jgi:hypothetical protein
MAQASRSGRVVMSILETVPFECVRFLDDDAGLSVASSQPSGDPK